MPAKKSAPPTAIYQLKITLQGLRPPIWRRVLVADNTSLAKLNYIIRIAMGWTNSHLHDFTIHGKRYTEPHPDDWEPVLDERKYTLCEAAPRAREVTLCPRTLAALALGQTRSAQSHPALYPNPHVHPQTRNPSKPATLLYRSVDCRCAPIRCVTTNCVAATKSVTVMRWAPVETPRPWSSYHPAGGNPQGRYPLALPRVQAQPLSD